MKKKVLITGAGSGFGKGVALELAKKGHNVTACVEISTQKTDLLNSLNELGLTMDVLVVDIRDEDERKIIFNKEIDVLVNNAGIMESGPIAEIPMKNVKRNFETNVFGTLAVTQGVLPQMVKRGNGKVITLSSVAGLVTMPMGAVYSATKQALEAVMEGLSIELAGKGVDFCVVNPGFYNTGFNDRGADTMTKWYNPDKSLSSPEILQSVMELLDTQADPKEQIDDLVKIVEEENSNFRNVCPEMIVPWIKAVEAKSWEAKSNEPVWVNPS